MQVKTNSGIVEGVCEKGCNIYKGIPYAEPPVGENRWTAPVKKTPWEGVWKADHFSRIPPQRVPDGTEPWGGLYYKEFYTYPEYNREQSEDCLYLNIWTPRDAIGKKLPVAFWIHGGGFAGGYSSEIEFDGAAYAARDVILVTIEYRLGLLGFLAHPFFDKENEKGVSGNYGILDQIEALRWVKENIEFFGGDPENITIFGQSAGSMSTQVLCSSPLTDGLFAKAILQSGISCEKTILYTPTLEEYEREVASVVTELTEAKSAEDLRCLTVKEILELQDRVNERLFPLGKGLMIVPNADGVVLPVPVPKVWREGKMKNIPYLAGSVTDDLGASPEQVMAGNRGPLHEENLHWSFQTESSYGKPAYIYYFCHSLPGDDAGAFHSAELWYMFGTHFRWWRPQTEEDRRLSEEMLLAWTTFMKTGSPSADSSWKPCCREDPFVKVFS